MYFTEKALLECKRQELSVRVCMISGSEVDLVIHSHASIAKLKEEALEVLEVVNKEKTIFKSNNYNLLHISTGHMLEDDYVVGLVITNGDELMLLPKRAERAASEGSELPTPVSAVPAASSDNNRRLYRNSTQSSGEQDVSSMMSVDVGVSSGATLTGASQSDTKSSALTSATAGNTNKSPTKDEILKATSKQRSVHTDRCPKDHLKILEFGVELQKILVTFVETSLKLLAMDSNADDVLREISEKINYVKSSSDAAMTADVDPLQQLKDMGFTDEQASKALRVNNNNVNSASEWLLKQSVESAAGSIDMDITQSVEEDVEMTESSDMPSTQTPHEVSDNVTVIPKYNIPIHAGTILKATKDYQRKKFKPNEAALQHFKEMGFDESSILDALREAGNNEDVACDMLLGERSSINYDHLVGLDRSQSIYKAIMSNPIIVSSLSNPKNLPVFLSMLENLPNIRNTQFIADPELSPLFSQVFRIYHTENYQLK